MNDEADPLIVTSEPTPRTPDVNGNQMLADPAVLSANFRPQWKTKVSFGLVLLTETLERIAFYGLICNMVLFLNSNPLQWTSYNAVNAMFVLNGISYIFAIFGGWLADACLGKFYTIVLCFLIYIAGFAFWPLFYPYPFRGTPDSSVPEPKWCSSGNVTSKRSPLIYFPMEHNVWARSENFSSPDPSYTPWDKEICTWAIYLSIAIIAVGYGSVRANIIPFGAHQFEHEGRTAVRVYFNWFYWCINIGALVAYGALGYIQQEQSYFWGYLIPLIVLVIAFITFLSGSCIFVRRPATGSVLTNILCVCRESLRVCCRTRRRRDLEVLNTDMRSMSERAPCYLDYARARYGGSFADSAVDDIKLLGKIILIFLAMVPYWTVYYQMQTTFVVQGLHMKLDFDHNDTMAAADERKFMLPAAWLSIFNVIFVLVLLPVLDRIVYPYLDRVGWSPSLRARIMVGMAFAVIAVTAAGVLEHYRLSVYWEGGTNHTHYQKIGDTYYKAANITVFYQLPQYAIIGISELFASIGGLELAYIYAPRSMQGVIMGIYWFSQGLGSFLGTGLLTAFKGVWFTTWDYGDINCETSPFLNPPSKCHLDYYFYFLAGILVIAIGIFAVISLAVDIGSRVPLRIQQDGQTVVRPGEGPDSAASTRSPSPYVPARNSEGVARRGVTRSDSER